MSQKLAISFRNGKGEEVAVLYGIGAHTQNPL